MTGSDDEVRGRSSREQATCVTKVSLGGDGHGDDQGAATQHLSD